MKYASTSAIVNTQGDSSMLLPIKTYFLIVQSHTAQQSVRPHWLYCSVVCDCIITKYSLFITQTPNDSVTWELLSNIVTQFGIPIKLVN